VLRPISLAATLWFVALAWCASALALDPSLDISQYAHTSWRVRDGFVKGLIYAIAQTPDGYLWLGTDFGLYRFDGVRAVPWESPSTQYPLGGGVRSLLVGRDGTLWIGKFGGLVSLKDGRFTRYPDLDGGSVRHLVEDREGTIWASYNARIPGAGKLCAIRNGASQCVGGDGRFGTGVYSLYQDRSGGLWAGTLNGIWRWKPGPPKFYPLSIELNGIEAISEDNNGLLLIGWKGGIYRFIDGKTEPYPLASKVPQFRVWTMVRDGGLWIGTQDDGLLHLHQGRTDTFSIADGLAGDSILGLFEDHEGDIWVCSAGGLDRFRDYSVATLTTKQGLLRSVVESVLADRNGTVWFGTFGGLNQWDHGRVTIPATGSASRDGKLGGSDPESLFQDQSGRIWISTLHGLGYLENGRFTLIKGVPGRNFLSIDEDVDRNTWAASIENGLSEVSPQNAVRNFTWAALGHKDFAVAIAADRRQGGLWLGFFRGGIAYFSDGQVKKTYSGSDGLAPGAVNDFFFDDGGAMWISTQSGLSRLKNNRIATLTGKNGLPCDTVHWAREESDGSMWLYTACGLVRIDRSELDAWQAAADRQEGATRKIQVAVFDSLDGVRNIVTANTYHPHVAKTPDGKLFFSSLDGLSIVDPHHLPFNKIPPPVHVEQVTADGKAYDAANGLQLGPHVRDLAIDYTALSLVVPEKVHFKVKLEGQDNDWRELVNVRHVEYTNLPPRAYRFHVIASNNSGVWNEAGAALEFSVLPAYYQTNWFRLLCVTAFVGLLWALYRLRLHQVQRQFALGLEARVGERLRIARELHDTLLQSFQGVAFQLQAARKLIIRKADNAEEVLNDAILATEEAIREGRSAIRDLRPEPAAQRNLFELLDAAGRELATAQELNGPAPNYRVLIEGKQQELSPMLQDEVYRISREVIRNAFAHAAASHIEVEVRYDPDHLRLRVRDDGKGIDPKVLAGGQSGHFGIPGMRERAERIGAHLDFWSEVGAGTEAELTVPASMAYQKPRNGHRIRLFYWAAGVNGKKR
jgi:signal transduction histidine kinase/ligand-binding sensor domain-containing protein